ncbi:hypothetical protein MLD38_001588 [Melastoma candidum]|uniref:Uncharacterized protein n=1 Tax=Melastoma candidum TaxID=119954 RepID=A0ACB9SD15_9MYRT|nr:hypothetical protein MLD38_001588 [Melastoma candidum]
MAPVSLPPGFRFHPTDEELVAYYLSRKINGRKIDLEIIPEVDLYKCEPWDLPGKSLLPSKDMEWYFFSPRDRKYPNGSRTNRATKAGYWKATGKDRKVSSQNRSVGTKKTLVYYRGRAPHGARSDWVMHEYRLDERECETASGLQDAYALCRVFKKSAAPVKPAERFNPTGVVERSAGYSYSNDYSISRNTCSPSIVNEGSSSFDEYNPNDSRWVQPMPEDSFNFPLASYPPSQVDIALECARLQNRFVAPPPLLPESFPQDLLFGDDDNLMVAHEPNSTSRCDILQEILSVAQASQDLIHQQPQSSSPLFSWDDKNYAPNIGAGFSFMTGAMPAFDHCEREVEISDLVGDIKVEGMTENLRWVGMSDKDLLKTFGEENKIMPMESITSYNRGNEYLNQGVGHVDDGIDFEVDFVSDHDDPTTRREDRYSDSPSFEIVEETKVSRGMFIATRLTAETMFHPTVPSEVVKVQSLHHGTTTASSSRVGRSGCSSGYWDRRGRRGPGRLSASTALLFISIALALSCVWAY